MYKLTFVWQKFCLVCFTKKHLLQDYCTKFFKLIIWIHQLIVFTCQTNSNHQVQQKSFFFYFSLHNFYLNGSSQQFIVYSLFFIYIYYLFICIWTSRRKKFNSWPTFDWGLEKNLNSCKQMSWKFEIMFNI